MIIFREVKGFLYYAGIALMLAGLAVVISDKEAPTYEKVEDRTDMNKV